MRFSYANRGQAFEEEVRLTNNQYKRKGIANIQKIATPVKVLNNKGGKVTGFYEKKSTLDFRGTVNPGLSISFDCKENNKDKRGLPLSYIQNHQVRYIREAIEFGETSFILCYMTMFDKRYYIPGKIVLEYYDRWQANKGKRGFNFIPVEVMQEIKSRNGFILDYLNPIKGECKNE